MVDSPLKPFIATLYLSQKKDELNNVDEGEQLCTFCPNILCRVIVTQIITTMLNLLPDFSNRMNRQVQQNVLINLLKCQRNFIRVLTTGTNQFSTPYHLLPQLNSLTLWPSLTLRNYSRHLHFCTLRHIYYCMAWSLVLCFSLFLCKSNTCSLVWFVIISHTWNYWLIHNGFNV